MLYFLMSDADLGFSIFSNISAAFEADILLSAVRDEQDLPHEAQPPLQPVQLPPFISPIICLMQKTTSTISAAITMILPKTAGIKN